MKEKEDKLNKLFEDQRTQRNLLKSKINEYNQFIRSNDINKDGRVNEKDITDPDKMTQFIKTKRAPARRRKP